MTLFRIGSNLKIEHGHLTAYVRSLEPLGRGDGVCNYQFPIMPELSKTPKARAER